MFDRLKKLFFAGTAAEEGGYQADDRQLAEAALMFHVISADGVVSENEREAINHRVAARFGLSNEETAELVEAAHRADAEAVDLYRFAKLLKRELDYEQRLNFIRELWEMVFADGVVHEIEDTIVWRVAQMLDVETRDRMELKRRVRDDRLDN
jgi:uncharacterized tellurite resistance protein B-like protein